ncbi:MAG: J domain-containing protein [Acidimicrobiales bacterium]
MRSHYDVLGVTTEAGPAEVRRAYVASARRLHPDRWIDASPAERRVAERGMQELNEAWRVLGHPDRRRTYDASLRRAAHRSTTHPSAVRVRRHDPDPERLPVDALARIVRSLPWVLILGVLAAIFVFTAYAGSIR